MARVGVCGLNPTLSMDCRDGRERLDHRSDPERRCEPKDKEGPKVRVIEALMAENNLGWLKRSIVGSTLKAIDFRVLHAVARTEWPHVVKVCELGAYKALLVFDTDQSAADALMFGMNGLLKFFYRVGRWNENDRGDKRRLWLECIGVPVHVWSEATFRLIGEQWGEVVACDPATTSCSSFSVGRVLIDTCIYEVIREKVCIAVGTAMFDVFVTETGKGEWALLNCGRNAEERGNPGRSIGEGCVHGSNASPADGGGGHRQLNSGGAVAEMMTLPVREKEQIKGIGVISPEELNEWSNKHLNLKLGRTMFKELAPNMKKAVPTRALEQEGAEDSERTVSCDLVRGAGITYDITSVSRCVGPSDNAVVLNGFMAQTLLTEPKNSALGLKTCSPHEKNGKGHEMDQGYVPLERGLDRVGSGEGLTPGDRVDGNAFLQAGADTTSCMKRSAGLQDGADTTGCVKRTAARTGLGLEAGAETAVTDEGGRSGTRALSVDEAGISSGWVGDGRKGRPRAGGLWSPGSAATRVAMADEDGRVGGGGGSGTDMLVAGGVAMGSQRRGDCLMLADCGNEADLQQTGGVGGGDQVEAGSSSGTKLGFCATPGCDDSCYQDQVCVPIDTADSNPMEGEADGNNQQSVEGKSGYGKAVDGIGEEQTKGGSDAGSET
ncbi:hypothetical protein HN51_047262, partial [Arachis hypogaea]